MGWIHSVPLHSKPKLHCSMDRHVVGAGPTLVTQTDGQSPGHAAAKCQRQGGRGQVGVFRRAPWKELSCKPQTMLAQAHGCCVNYIKLSCLCRAQFCRKTALCVKHGFDPKTWLLFKPRFKFKRKHVCKPGFWKRPNAPYNYEQARSTRDAGWLADS